MYALIGLLFVVAACGDGPVEDAAPGGDGPGRCAPLGGPETPRAVFGIFDRSAFSPDVHPTPEGFVAYVESVVLGDGGTYRAESADGLDWSTPVRVFDERGRVLPRSAETLLYYGRWDGRGTAPYQRIGLARSADGLPFVDEGLVWSGSGERGEDGLPLEHELMDPIAWDDGARVHLFFTASADRFDEDMGYGISSVGHAVAGDAVAFEAAPWPFPARACVDAPRGWTDWESLALQATVRPACAACELPGLWLVLQGRRCDGTVGSFLTSTADGATFTEPTPIALPVGAGTLLVSDDTALFLHATYSEHSQIDAVALARPAALPGCR